MPDDSIILKVQLDTSDIEKDLKQSVKSGIQAGAKEARAELANKRSTDLLKQKTSDKLMLDNSKFSNQRALISDKESSTLRIIAKRAEDRQKELAAKARIKIEEDARRLSNAKEMAQFRESLKREREERRRTAVGGIFGSIGGALEALNPVKRGGELRDFLKDYKRGKGMRGTVVSDPYAVSEGFGAGYTGKGKIAGLAKILGPAVGAITGMGLLFNKLVLKPTLKIGKQIVRYFEDIAKSVEPLKEIFNLIALPFQLLYTYAIEPIMSAILPLVERAIAWIEENEDKIKNVFETVGNAFAKIFEGDKIKIIDEIMERVVGVFQWLADIFAKNAQYIDASSFQSFVTSTISAVAGMIQDILVGIVDWCYSPEGEAILVSLSETLGRIMGSLITTVVEMLPMFAKMGGSFLVGVLEGIVSMVAKTIANMFDKLDQTTNGAVTRYVNAFYNICNWVIDRVNDVINFLNNIPFVDIDTVAHIELLDTNNVGSNFSGGVSSFTNNHTIASTYTVTNNITALNDNSMRSITSRGL